MFSETWIEFLLSTNSRPEITSAKLTKMICDEFDINENQVSVQAFPKLVGHQIKVNSPNSKLSKELMKSFELFGFLARRFSFGFKDEESNLSVLKLCEELYLKLSEVNSKLILKSIKAQEKDEKSVGMESLVTSAKQLLTIRKLRLDLLKTFLTEIHEKNEQRNAALEILSLELNQQESLYSNEKRETEKSLRKNAKKVLETETETRGKANELETKLENAKSLMKRLEVDKNRLEVEVELLGNENFVLGRMLEESLKSSEEKEFL